MTTDVGRCASRRSAALRAEPVALSQAKPAAAIAEESEDDFEFGYDGQDIGCCNCDLGWKHGCCDDMCIACTEPQWCENAIPCRHCNPFGDIQ